MISQSPNDIFKLLFYLTKISPKHGNTQFTMTEYMIKKSCKSSHRSSWNICHFCLQNNWQSRVLVCYQQIFIIQISIIHFFIIQVFHAKSCHSLYFSHVNRSWTWTNIPQQESNHTYYFKFWALIYGWDKLWFTLGEKWRTCRSHLSLHLSFLVISPLLLLLPQPDWATLLPARRHSPHHPSLHPGTGQGAAPSVAQTGGRKERELLNHTCCWHINNRHQSQISSSDMTRCYLFGSRCPLTPGRGVPTATHGLLPPKS